MSDERKTYDSSTVEAVCKLIRRRAAEDLMRAVAAAQREPAKGNKDESTDSGGAKLH
jgi:hypothetical protein